MSLLKKKRKNKIAGVYYNDTQAFKLYQEAINYRIKSIWRDAGDAYCRCAETYIRMKMLLVAATLYTEAAEQYLKADKAEAILIYQKSIKLYCDVGRFDIAGKLNRHVAMIQLKAKHWEDAAANFHKAANFLAGDKLLDQSDLCLKESAQCLIRLKDYKEAGKLYEMIGRNCLYTNLRRFHARDYLLKSIFCLMAIPEEEEQIIPITSDSVAGTMGGTIFASMESSTFIPGQGNNEVGKNRTSLNNPTSGAVPGKSSLRLSANQGVVGGSPQKTSFHLSGNISGGDVKDGTRVSIADDTSISSLGNNSLIKDINHHHNNNNTTSIQNYYTIPSMYQTKYDRIYSINERYDKVDSLWRRSKEKLFIRILLRARNEYDKDTYIDHIYFWHNVHLLDEQSLKMLKIPLDEIIKEHDRRKRIKIEEELARKKAEERAANLLAGISERLESATEKTEKTEKTNSENGKSSPTKSEKSGKSEKSVDSGSINGSFRKSSTKK